jgi:hypothetical protein
MGKPSWEDEQRHMKRLGYLRHNGKWWGRVGEHGKMEEVKPDKLRNLLRSLTRREEKK